MRAFDLFRPKDLYQAFDRLELNGHETMLMSGGTDLLIWIKKGLVSPKEVVDLGSIDSLSLRTQGQRWGSLSGPTCP